MDRQVGALQRPGDRVLPGMCAQSSVTRDHQGPVGRRKGPSWVHTCGLGEVHIAHLFALDPQEKMSVYFSDSLLLALTNRKLTYFNLPMCASCYHSPKVLGGSFSNHCLGTKSS